MKGESDVIEKQLMFALIRLRPLRFGKTTDLDRPPGAAAMEIEALNLFALFQPGHLFADGINTLARGPRELSIRQAPVFP